MRRSILPLGLSCLVGLAAPREAVGGVEPSITGVSEGSVIVLAASAIGTNLAVSVQGAGASVTKAVFDLERQGVLFQRLTSAPPFAITFTNLPLGKYFLTGSFQSSTGASTMDISFDIRAAALNPINDHWSQAVLIAATNTTVNGSNVFATREPNEALHAGVGGGRSVWWSWLATSNTIVTATTAGSGFDTVLAAYADASPGSLKVIAENDDVGTNSFSQVSFRASVGTTYYFAVDGALSSTGIAETGSIRLRIVAAAPPAITIASPTDGLLALVLSPLAQTNVNVSALISDLAGIDRVEYWLESDKNPIWTGIVTPPYQWNLGGLLPGDYLLTLHAVSQQGLIGDARIGFSVRSIAPQIFLTGSSASGVDGLPITVSGMKGVNYRLEASTNLTAWSQLVRWTNFTGIQRVNDMDASKLKERFYRVQAP